MNYSVCSNGTRISEAGIKARYSDALREKHAGNPRPICECCGKEMAVDNCHIIAKARCKVLKITEMIWNPLNFVSACRECHMAWEGWKSGKYLDFINIVQLMKWLKTHDPEGYQARINFEYS
jgi:hypothetical protein